MAPNAGRGVPWRRGKRFRYSVHGVRGRIQVTKTDPLILQMALLGYARELQEVRRKIEELHAALKPVNVSAPAPITTQRPKRKMSLKARREIREAS